MHRTLLASILVSATTIAHADTPTRTSAADSDSLGEVTFKRGSKRVAPAARDDVEQIAAWHADHPEAILILEGHTSREGSWNKNLRVSQDRTDAVRDALVVAGADPSRIVLTARGDNRATKSRRGTGRVVIRATGDFPALARLQRAPGTGGEDTRAARRGAVVDQRRSGGETVRGRDTGGGGGGNTIVIVPGAPGSAPTIVQSGGGSTGLDNAGGAGRTSGGTGASAQTGLGTDPTDGEDRVTTNPAGTNVVGGGVAAEGTTTSGGSRGGGAAPAGTAGGATGGTSTGSPVGAGVTGTGPGAATAPTTGGATGAGTATGAGASGAGTAGSTTGAGTAGGAGAPVGGTSAPTGGGGGSR